MTSIMTNFVFFLVNQLLPLVINCSPIITTGTLTYTFLITFRNG